MKTNFFYVVFLLFMLNSCSKSHNDMATRSADENATEAVSQDTISITGNATADNMDSADSNFPVVTSPPPMPDPVAEQPAVSAKSDSVASAYKKINRSAMHHNIETITPILPNVVKNHDDAQTYSPKPLSPHDSAPSDTAVVQEKPKNAVLGFSYFPQIPQNETRDLRVFVKVQSDDKEVTKKLKTIEKEDLEFTKSDDSSIVCIVKNIEAFKKLSIKPIYDNDDFRITRVDDDVQSFYDTDPNEQMLDFQNGNYWHWKVKAIAKAAHIGNITLLIKAETPQGQKIKLAERQINIKIGIDAPKPTFAQKIYTLADAHFKEILTLIIIPLAIWFYNSLRKRYLLKKQKDNPNNP